MPEITNWNLGDAIALADIWQTHCANSNMPREFFPIIHSVAELLCVNHQQQRVVELLRSEITMGVEHFLGYRIEHASLLAKALFDADRNAEAQELIEYYISRPYLFDDFGKLGFFLLCQVANSLKNQEPEKLAHCVKLLVTTQAGMQDANLIRAVHLAGGIKQLVMATKEIDFSTRLLLKAFGISQKLAGKGVAAGVIGKGLHFSLNILRSISRLKGGNLIKMLPQRSANKMPDFDKRHDNRPVLVTRAMGGIGDILMMTPGLRALSIKYPGREIHFALPKSFHPVLNNNPDIVLRDINGDVFYQEDFFAFYNLTECPASRVETTTLPNVKANRIDIFSAAMGIESAVQDKVGRKPVYIITQEETEWAKFFFNERGLKAEECVALQPYAADSYKNYPDMETLALHLANNQHVLVFHSEILQGFDHENILKIDNLPLRKAIALLAQCKMLIAVDSSFVHIAAALGKKTVAIYGPTDGAVFTMHYPNCTVVNGYAEANCTSCWRSKFVVCAKSGDDSSMCLQAVPVRKFLDASKRLTIQER